MEARSVFARTARAGGVGVTFQIGRRLDGLQALVELPVSSCIPRRRCGISVGEGTCGPMAADWPHPEVAAYTMAGEGCGFWERCGS